MTSGFHGKQTIEDGLHGFIAFVYSGASERLAASGFVASDVHKVALDSDTGDLNRLSNVTPTWVSLGGSNPAFVSAVSSHFVGLTQHGISSFGASVVSAASAGQLRDTLGLSVVATASASTVAVAGVVPITNASGYIPPRFTYYRGGLVSNAGGNYGIPDYNLVPVAWTSSFALPTDTLIIQPFVAGKDIVITGSHLEKTITVSAGAIAVGLYSCVETAVTTNASIAGGYTGFTLMAEFGTTTSSAGGLFTVTGASVPIYQGLSYAVGVARYGGGTTSYARACLHQIMGSMAVPSSSATNTFQIRSCGYHASATSLHTTPGALTEVLDTYQDAGGVWFPAFLSWVDQ